MFNKQDALIGMVLGDYKIERLIARGGMGRVYEATDRPLNRRIALKIITMDEDRAAELMSRFQREARAISKLDDHPNIVNIYRYGEHEGLHYLAMQYIEGQSLAEYYESLKKRGARISPEELLHVFRQIATALDHAHDHGVIHRDIKPANIMLEGANDKKGFRKAILMDFGLVMQVDTTSTLGSAFGTPRYIAPEQAISSQQACAQSDIYSLGVIIYELLAGRPPFDEDETPMSIALSHITKAPPLLEKFRPDLPKAVNDVVMKAMEKKPENRYQRATEFIADLEAAFEGVLSETGSAQVVAGSSATPVKRPDELRRAARTGAAPTTPPRSRLALIGGVVLVIVLFIGGLLVVLGGGDEDDSGDSPAAADVNTPVPASPTDNAAQPEVTDPPPTPAPVTLPAGVPADLSNLVFSYDRNQFTIQNNGNEPVDLGSLMLQRSDNQLNLSQLSPSILAAEACTYVATTEAGQPLPCADPAINPLVLATGALVWAHPRNQGDFQVYYNDTLIARCPVSVNEDQVCTLDETP